MKKSICVVTGSRADYGLLSPVIKKLLVTGNFDLKVAATGAHLSEEFGLTYKEIEADGLSIDARIDVLQDDDSHMAMSGAIGTGIIRFAEYFEQNRPDMVVLLGDRFEIFAAVTAAAISCVPIAHLHGGETTEGAVDEFLRHSITKMSYLHFTSTEQYRRRIISMGEAPERVFNVGATGVENVLSMTYMDKEELARSINLELSMPYALVAFHPVTLENNTAEDQIEELLSALAETNGLQYIFTKANADAGSRAINKNIDAYCEKKSNAVALTSLGRRQFLSAMKYCEFIIGNSSSGIIEAPSLKIPTINIGDRQKGRIRAASVIDCRPEKHAILGSIDKARSRQFLREIANQENPYENGNTSEKIVAVITDFLQNDKINLKKSFYDRRGCDHDQ